MFILNCVLLLQSRELWEAGNYLKERNGAAE